MGLGKLLLWVGHGHLAEPAHVFDRDDHFDVHLLLDAGVDDCDRTRRTGAARCAVGVAAQETSDLLERPLGGAETDPLHWLLSDLVEPFQRESHV